MEASVGGGGCGRSHRAERGRPTRARCTARAARRGSSDTWPRLWSPPTPPPGRACRSAGPSPSPGLSAFLRAVDSTLWTVDTYAGLGSEHIAGLVGRPLAVVRATLRLDVDDDLDELDLSDAARRAGREQAYRDLADRAFSVRVGELTRSDDGLLAFFVDDDYEHVHVVDKVVRDGALASGRWQGHFGQFGTTRSCRGSSRSSTRTWWPRMSCSCTRARSCD